MGRRHFLKGKKAPLPHPDINDDERPKKRTRISIAAAANGAANGVVTENNEHFFEENSEDETATPSYAQDADTTATNIGVQDVALHIQEQLCARRNMPTWQNKRFLVQRMQQDTGWCFYLARPRGPCCK